MTKTGRLDRSRGSLLGLAIGDALGATLEFTRRGESPPLTDLVGGGVHHLAPGEWTDDTSMALCLATSLIECRGFNSLDQMRRYARWMAEGYLSSNGRCFDVGGTVMRAMLRFRDTGSPLAGSPAPDTAGNGSLMRLAPIPLFFHPDRESVRHYAVESSRTTHAAPECLDACRLLASMIDAALADTSKEAILSVGAADEAITAPRIAAIARGEYRGRDESRIRTSGYVVDTLEAALWCFDRTDDFASGALEAANLADDADTTAAVFGQLAGAYYGADRIPATWRARVAHAPLIEGIAEMLAESGATT